MKKFFEIVLLLICFFLLKLKGMLSHILDKVIRQPAGAAAGDDENGGGRKKVVMIRGKVVLMKKNVLDFNDLVASIVDRFDELLGRRVSLQLISAENGDHANEYRGYLGSPAHLEDWITTITPLSVGESAFNISFDWEKEIGEPGAFLIKNNHHNEFYLKTFTLEDVPGYGRIHFVCNSWVYPAKYYKTDRVFFTNQTYLPHEMPISLHKYRDEELLALRGDGQGELQEWDRVYDYAYYNDLGDPDKGFKYARPVLGGSIEYPYPRRGRTSRPPTKSDPKSESRLPLLKSLNIYVPRDERFNYLKLSYFLGTALKVILQFTKPELEAFFYGSSNEFDSFEDEMKIYEGGIKLPKGHLFEKIMNKIPLELLKQALPTEGEGLLRYPLPQVIKEDQSTWRTDEEFVREMLAGINPVIISLLEEFPPTSKLDSKLYGDQNSSISEEHIKENMDGLTISAAIKSKKLFILDHHDALMPYLRQINNTSTKTYASRTLLFLNNDETLKPLAIELSLPHPEGDRFGAVSNVYTPAKGGVEGSIWQLAKAYVAVNDSGYHQLISHWLNTHAAIEPFVISTNRQLSVVHPIYKLLHPHFRDTMCINALARQILIQAGGIVEATVFPTRYAMEMSSVIYKSWVFTDHALPTDLKKRGMAVDDPESKHGLRLLIKDYPYAVDGLEIWSAIENWVRNYCHYYYKSNEMVQHDSELQSWWKELKEEGHGDKKDAPWWPKLRTVQELIDTCTIIIWVASALHAALNYGQYPYAGYLPNRPTTSRRFMPEKGTPEYLELEKNPDKEFLKTITGKMQTLLGLSIIELLSSHTNDEVYLGQRDTNDWSTDVVPLKAFEEFGHRLSEIAKRIVEMNNEEQWKNRVGSVKVSYTLLYPTSEGGITGKGIPNSVSM